MTCRHKVKLINHGKLNRDKNRPIADYDAEFYNYNKRKKEEKDEYQDMIDDLDDRIRVIDRYLNYFWMRGINGRRHINEYKVIEHSRKVANLYLDSAKRKLELIKNKKNRSLDIHLRTFDLIFDINTGYDFCNYAHREINNACLWYKDVKDDIYPVRKNTTLRSATVLKKTN